MDTRTQHSFRSHPSALSEIRRWVRDRAAESGLADGTTEELVIAVNEASTNAVLHSGRSRIDVGWAETHEDVVVEITDDGVFGAMRAVGGTWEEAGRGIPLMLSAADAVEIVKGTPEQRGTIVRISKRKRHP